MRVAIIGAGLGGLTAGAFLAKAGHEVLVFDHNQEVGGVAALAHQNGYSWEQGPLILGSMLPGEKIYGILQELNITLETKRADRGIIFNDYQMWPPREYQGPYWRAEQLKRLFPDESKGIDAYYGFYDDMMLLKRLNEKQASKIRIALAFLKVRKYSKMTAAELARHFFHNEKLAALFLGIFADFCVSPSEVQGLGIPFVNAETAFDRRIPLYEGSKRVRDGYCNIIGGVQKLPEALSGYITDHHGKIMLSVDVESVLFDEKTRKATGVKLSDSSRVDVDIVVGSGGARDFFYNLVGKQHLDEAYLKVLESFKPMEAVFMVHLGVDFDPMDYMRSELCYCYKNYDIEGAVERLRSGIYHQGRDGYLIYVPSAHAPEMAPAGKHCLTIYTVAPDTIFNGDWEKDKATYAEALIDLASEQLPDLEKHITEMKIMTALDYRSLTHMEKCSFGGVVPIWGQKNPAHMTGIENLYFVGQQSENAGGVDNVIPGARETAQLILSRLPETTI